MSIEGSAPRGNQSINKCCIFIKKNVIFFMSRVTDPTEIWPHSSDEADYLNLKYKNSLSEKFSGQTLISF